MAEWAVQSINWKLTNYPPTVASDSLHIGPKYYPAEAWARRLEGDCVVHAFIELDARPNNPSIVQSTGSPVLYQACLKAVMEGRYWAGTANGAVYGAWIDIPMSWRFIEVHEHSRTAAGRDNSVGDRALSNLVALQE